MADNTIPERSMGDAGLTFQGKPLSQREHAIISIMIEGFGSGLFPLFYNGAISMAEAGKVVREASIYTRGVLDGRIEPQLDPFAKGEATL